MFLTLNTCTNLTVLLVIFLHTLTYILGLYSSYYTNKLTDIIIIRDDAFPLEQKRSFLKLERHAAFKMILALFMPPIRIDIKVVMVDILSL